MYYKNSNRSRCERHEKNQLTKGENRRIMYVENKDGDLCGVNASVVVASPHLF